MDGFNRVRLRGEESGQALAEVLEVFGNRGETPRGFSTMVYGWADQENK